MVYSGILALRRRSVWEAADAGLLLWRRNLGYLIPFFAIPFWVCAFALQVLPGLLWGGGLGGGPLDSTALLGGVVSPGGFRAPGAPISPAWSWFLLWWLNPLFDRLILHVVGRRFFEPALGLGSLPRGLGRSLGRGLPGDLLWRRLSPWRAVMLPLRILEQGSGTPSRGGYAGGAPSPAENRRRIRDRWRVLSPGGLHFNIFLGLWCVSLEWVLLAGETLFVILIARLFFNAGPEDLGQLFAGKGLYYFTAWCVNHMVVESLYVCMGCGVYLNSRVEIEGWDIELMFRGFAGRRGRGGGITAVLLLVCCLGLWRPAPGFGQDAGAGAGTEGGAGGESLPPPALGKDMPAKTLERILARDLGTEKRTRSIRFKKREDSGAAAYPGEPASWVLALGKAGALTLRAALILAFGALVLAGGVRAYRHRRGPPRRDRTPAPSPSPGGPPPPADPRELAEAAARAAGRAGYREAWALCYAAALAALSRYRNLRFPPGATEYRCLALVRGAEQGRELARDFAGLIRHWVSLAYGGSLPPAGAFEESLAWVRSLRDVPCPAGQAAPAYPAAPLGPEGEGRG